MTKGTFGVWLRCQGPWRNVCLWWVRMRTGCPGHSCWLLSKEFRVIESFSTCEWTQTIPDKWRHDKVYTLADTIGPEGAFYESQTSLRSYYSSDKTGAVSSGLRDAAMGSCLLKDRSRVERESCIFRRGGRIRRSALKATAVSNMTVTDSVHSVYSPVCDGFGQGGPQLITSLYVI